MLLEMTMFGGMTLGSASDVVWELDATQPGVCRSSMQVSVSTPVLQRLSQDQYDAALRSLHMTQSVFMWLCQNPGRDSEDVSEHFGITGLEASDTVQKLLRMGLLEFDE